MRFNLQDAHANVVMGPISETNAYLTAYGSTVEGYKEPRDLAVGEVSRRTYSLSGQKPTTYAVVRLEDEP